MTRYAGSAVADLNSSVWWQVLPWPLLVLFWVYIVIRMRRLQ